MRIERINDNQIRCTLSASELASRDINLGELAYGSEKARALFHEMIEQASEEFGFEAEDIPLMVEAVPLSAESIMLIITKIDDPDELDTRFSKFTSFDSPEDDSLEGAEESARGADDILDLFHSILDASEKKQENEKTSENIAVPVTRVFCFQSLDEISHAGKILNGFYQGENSVYKDEKKGIYYLIVSNSLHTPEEFNKVCNILCEYGSRCAANPAVAARIQEHMKPISCGQALSVLAGL